MPCLLTSFATMRSRFFVLQLFCGMGFNIAGLGSKAHENFLPLLFPQLCKNIAGSLKPQLERRILFLYLLCSRCFRAGSRQPPPP